MAEITAAVIKPTVFTFDKVKAAAKLKEVIDYYLPYHGKAGFNPHFYLQKEVLPLKATLETPGAVLTEELYNKIMALQCNESFVKADVVHYGRQAVIMPAIQQSTFNTKPKTPEQVVTQPAQFQNPPK